MILTNDLSLYTLKLYDRFYHLLKTKTTKLSHSEK